MNERIPETFFVEEYEKEPENARREYGALFTDLQASFLPQDAIENCVDLGLKERRPERAKAYYAAIDAAFKKDYFTLCIGHVEDETVIVDLGRGWKPDGRIAIASDEQAYEVAKLCRQYGVRTVYGDQYCSEPLRRMLQEWGVTFIEIVLSGKRMRRETVDGRHEIGASKQDIYGVLKTLILQARLRIPENTEGIAQLCMLEAKRSWAGYESSAASAQPTTM